MIDIIDLWCAVALAVVLSLILNSPAFQHILTTVGLNRAISPPFVATFNIDLPQMKLLAEKPRGSSVDCAIGVCLREVSNIKGKVILFATEGARNLRVQARVNNVCFNPQGNNFDKIVELVPSLDLALTSGELDAAVVYGHDIMTDMLRPDQHGYAKLELTIL